MKSNSMISYFLNQTNLIENVYYLTVYAITRSLNLLYMYVCFTNTKAPNGVTLVGQLDNAVREPILHHKNTS